MYKEEIMKKAKKPVSILMTAALTLSPVQANTPVLADDTQLLGEKSESKLDPGLTAGEISSGENRAIDLSEYISYAEGYDGEVSYIIPDSFKDDMELDGSTLTVKKGGHFKVTVTLSETDKYLGATKNLNLHIMGSPVSVKDGELHPTTGEQDYTDFFTVNEDYMGSVTLEVTSGTDIVELTADNKLNPIGLGTATVSIKTEASGIYLAGTKTATIEVTKETVEITGPESVTMTYGSDDFDVMSLITLTKEYDGQAELSVKTGSGDKLAIVDGNLHALKAGNAEIVITAEETDMYAGSEITVPVTIDPIAITIAPTEIKGTYGDAARDITDYYSVSSSEYDGTVSWSVTKGSDVVSIDKDGKITFKKSGSAEITLSATQTDYYSSAQAKINVTVTTAPVTAEIVDAQASLQMTYGDDPVDAMDLIETLSEDYDGTLTFSVVEGGEGYISIGADNKITALASGNAEIRVHADKSAKYNEFNDTISVNVLRKRIGAVTTDIVMTYGDTAVSAMDHVTLEDGYDGTVTFETKTNDGSISLEGDTVTAVKAGTATLRFAAEATGKYEGIEDEIQVTVNRAKNTLSADTIKGAWFDEPLALAPLVSTASDYDGTLSFEVTEGSDAISVENGILTFIQSGNAKIKITAEKTDCYNEASITVNVVVDRADPRLNVLNSETTYGDTDIDISSLITIRNDYDGTVATAITSGTGVITLSEGKIHAEKQGTAKITVTAPQTEKFDSATKTITVTVARADSGLAVNNISTSYGKADIYVWDYMTTTAGYDGTLSYEIENNDGVAEIVDDKIHLLKAGTIDVVVTGTQTDKYEGAEKTITLTAAKAVVDSSVVSPAASFQMTYGDDPAEVEALIESAIDDYDGTFTYSVAEAGQDTISISGGKISASKSGNTEIAVHADATDKYNAFDATVTVNVLRKRVGPVITDIVMTYGDAPLSAEGYISLEEGYDGQITYSVTSNDGSISLNGSEISAIKAGTAVVHFAAEATDRYEKVEDDIEVTVNRATNTISAEPVKKAWFDDPVTLSDIVTTNEDYDGTIVYEILEGSAAIDIENGVMSFKQSGNAVVKATAPKTDRYNAISVTFDVTVDRADAELTAADANMVYSEGDVNIADLVSTRADYDGEITAAVTSGTGVVTITNGVIHAEKQGTAEIRISASQTDKFDADSKTITVTVARTDAGLTVNDISTVYGEADLDLWDFATTKEGYDGQPSYTFVSNSGVIEVVDGKLHAKKAGTAVINVSLPQTDRYNSAEGRITLTVERAETAITAENLATAYGNATSDLSDSINITEGYDGSAVFEITSGAGVVSVQGSVLTPVKPGSATIRVTAPATDCYKQATAEIKVSVAKKNWGTLAADDIVWDGLSFVYNGNDTFVITGHVKPGLMENNETAAVTAVVKKASKNASTENATFTSCVIDHLDKYEGELSASATVKVTVTPAEITVNAAGVTAEFGKDLWNRLCAGEAVTVQDFDAETSVEGLADSLKAEFVSSAAGKVSVKAAAGRYSVGTHRNAVSVVLAAENIGNFTLVEGSKANLTVTAETTADDIAAWSRVSFDKNNSEKAYKKNNTIYIAPGGKAAFTLAAGSLYDSIAIQTGGGYRSVINGMDTTAPGAGTFYLYDSENPDTRTDADAAENGSQDNTIPEGTFYYDATAPGIFIDDEKQTALGEEGVRSAEFTRYINGGTITHKITAEDAESGLDSLEYTIVKVIPGAADEKIITAAEKLEWTAVTGQEITTPEDLSDGAYVIVVRAKDHVTNTSYAVTEGFVIDSEQPGLTVSGIGKTLYNGDIDYTISLSDDAAGLKKVDVVVTAGGQTVAGRTSGDVHIGSFSKEYTAFSTIEEIEKGLNDTLKGRIPGDLNINGIKLAVTVTDQARNKKTYENLLDIDITAPAAEISFDNNSATNGKYFDKERTATITVTERDYDEKDLIFTITADGTSHKVSADGLSSMNIPGVTFVSRTEDKSKAGTDGHTVTYKIKFGSETGADHDFGISAAITDKASNTGRSTYAAGTVAGSSFVVDKKAPTATATFSAGGETFTPGSDKTVYVKNDVTVTMKVDERNFAPESTVYTFTQLDNSGNAVNVYSAEEFEKLKTGSSWAADGNTHSISLARFTTGANYSMSVTFKDKAGNEVTLPASRFTIDRTAPKGQIIVDGTHEYTSLSSATKFTIFRNGKIDSIITGTDDVSGIKSIKYYLYVPGAYENGTLDIPATAEALEALSWTESTSVTIQPDAQAVVYARIEDNAGNVTYLNTTDGIICDNTPPVIELAKDDSVIHNASYTEVFEVMDQLASETFSGIRAATYEVYADDKLTQSGSFDIPGEKDGSSRTQKVELKAVLDAALNNSNNVRLVIKTEDHSGNKAEAEKSYAFDTTAPVLTAVFDNNNPVNGKYFNQARTMTLSVRERNYSESKLKISITIDGSKAEYTIADLIAGKAAGVTAKKISDTQSNTAKNRLTDDRVTSYSITFGADGKTDHDYVIDASLTDDAGNTVSSINFGSSKPGSSFTIDEIAPVMNVRFVTPDGAAVTAGLGEETRTYNTQSVVPVFTIEERNFSGNDINVTAQGFDLGGAAAGNASAAVSSWTDNGNTHTGTLPAFSADANYRISAVFEDLAGNSVSVPMSYFTVDKTAPAGSLTVQAGGDSATYGNYAASAQFRFFTNASAVISRMSEDATSGVAGVSYWVYTPQAEARNDFVLPGIEEIRNAAWQPWNENTITLTPEQQSIIYLRITDKAGNNTYINSAEGLIIDKTAPESPSIEIQMADKNIHNGDVPFTITVNDASSGGTYAGLKSVSYEVISNGKVTQTGNYDAALTGRALRTKSITRTETIKAADNNSNHVTVRVYAEDYAGNHIEAEKDLMIDVTAPRIEITYDKTTDTEHYNGTRTATVRVYDRNFSPDNLSLDIKSARGGAATIGAWTLATDMGENDNAVSVMQITFDRDDDYTVTATLTDKAGNAGDLGRTDSFTIDTEKPAVSLTFDNNDVLNGKYYDDKRIAEIHVKDLNFNKDSAVLTVTAAGEDGELGKPVMSAWEQRNGEYVATVPFVADGAYTMTFAIRDIAGNQSDEVTADFVVDTTDPELEITGVEDKKAYSGKFDIGAVFGDWNAGDGKAELTIKGARHTEKTLDGTWTETDNGGTFAAAEITEDKENDDVYTLTARFADQAGNPVEKTVTFSVNRFGSNFTMDEETTAFLDRFYNQEPRNIVVTETNVDTLVHREITVGINGTTKTLEEGKDYAVSELEDNGWKQYVYNIDASNFTEEGVYEIIISSEDAAGNRQDNKLKEKPITFAIDKSAPSCIIAGIENGSQYHDTTKTFTVTTSDNMAPGKLEIYNNDELIKTYTADEIEDANGKFEITLQESNDYQNIRAVATDAVGNAYETDNIRVLVTTNPWMRFFRNTPLFVGTIAGSVAGIGVIAFLIAFFKKRKKKK